MKINNKKGFAMVMTLSLLPIFLAGLLIAWASIGFFQQDLALKHACRSEGIAGQKTVGPLLKKLLDLNPRAKKLKQDLDKVNRDIERESLRVNGGAVGALLLKKAAIEIKRYSLDVEQKALIYESNLALSRAFAQGSANIRSNAQQVSNEFFKVSIKNTSGSAPTLAVRPDYSDIAPTYSTIPDFTNKQALAHEWQYSVTLQKPFSNYLHSEFDFKKACAVSLKEEYKKWNPLITKARFSSKSVW